MKAKGLQAEGDRGGLCEGAGLIFPGAMAAIIPSPHFHLGPRSCHGFPRKKENSIFFSFFSGLHQPYMEVPRLGVKSDSCPPTSQPHNTGTEPHLRPRLQSAAMQDA